MDSKIVNEIIWSEAMNCYFVKKRVIPGGFSGFSGCPIGAPGTPGPAGGYSGDSGTFSPEPPTTISKEDVDEFLFKYLL